jgi:ribonuclease-3
VLQRLKLLLKPLSDSDKKISSAVFNITGFSPGNLSLYKLAFSHSSAARENSQGVKESYERLEFLGDSLLGAVVAEYLFKKFPFQDEGFLTDIRSRIVNREALNRVGKKMGLMSVVSYSGSVNHQHRSLYGDVLEALVGAVYLDKDYKTCRNFIMTQILDPHFDLDEVIQTNSNHKSVLIEWSQREGKKIRFEIIDEKGSMHSKEFTAVVILEDSTISQGVGTSKKRAEQSAAEKACLALKLSTNQS